MSAISIEIAKKHLEAWLEAELEVTTNQSYTIGTRSLTRANLSEIREQITFWKAEVEKIEKFQKNKGRNRVMRVVPRDL